MGGLNHDRQTDKKKIKEEIEKQIDYAEDDTRYTESYREGLIAAYQTIKAFIDSLPEESGCEVNFTTKNEDLEEEFNRFLDEVSPHVSIGVIIRTSEGVIRYAYYHHYLQQWFSVETSTRIDNVTKWMFVPEEGGEK